MIIDAHAHLGHDYVFDEEITEEELITQYRKDHVDGAIIQPFISRPYIEETKAYHNRIAEFCDAGKGLFYGMASINPHFKDEEVYDELKRCVKELGFVGVKITPIAHAVNPASKDGMKIFDMARELKITVMVHTGSGAPFSDPMMILPAATSFEPEALKAQAVAARTYTLYKMQTGGNHGDTADICTDSTCCQAYISEENARNNWGENADAYEEKIETAVRETDGETILYGGVPILAVFHSCSAGQTRSSGQVWVSDLLNP